MKIDAVGVCSSNLVRTVQFYSLLGFKFGEYQANEQHLEPETPEGSARLMIDSVEMLESLLGQAPKAGNHSSFAINFDTPAELNEVAQKIKSAGFTLYKEPWDAPWGQRYAVVEDPDGYKVDLYAKLPE